MTKEIVFVTSNKGKIASAQSCISNVRVIPYNAELIEPRSDDIKEIAKQKVLQAYNLVNKPCIALDSGFFVDELNGFPKAYVHHMLDTIGIEGLLKLMNGTLNRKCEFKTCLAYYDEETMKFFESNTPGRISTEIRGNNNESKWSDLWYIFIPNGFDKTLAEFSDKDFQLYNNIKKESCIKEFGKWFKNF